MNLKDGGSDYKPEAEWRLYFDDFKKFYGDKERYERDDYDEDDEDDEYDDDYDDDDDYDE